MERVLLQKVIKLNKARKRRLRWKQVVSVMAAVVVFCTTYALILPAITMEQDTVCGMEEHVHDETCYTEETTVLCGVEEAEGHTHSEACFEVLSEPGCVPEEPHTHEEACYGEAQLICSETESEGHMHGEGCFLTETVVGCGLEESETHMHDEACYTETETLVCELLETVPHVHEESCYEKPLVCTEPPPHEHTDACFTKQICTEEESEGHVHDSTCPVEINRTLICELPEHVHEDACYPETTAPPADPGYLCGFGKHAHTENCYDAEGTLICSVPEHEHEAACVLEDYDASADVETAADWEASLSEITRTGNWNVDLTAIALSQLGYTESKRNVILQEDGALKGYTRYGAWYGIPYGDWCAMFASFCMNYSGIEDIPTDASCSEWVTQLTERNIFRTPDVYEPKGGDLIFFDLNEDGSADHMGIVTKKLEADGETPAKITTVEGNLSDSVTAGEYSLTDPKIVGYGLIPEAKTTTLISEGEDYSVEVVFDSAARIPADAALSVSEILEGTPEYEEYFEQTLLAVRDPDLPEEEKEVSFARFFDISFTVNGETVEPAAPVQITVRYDDTVMIPENNSGMAVHFAKDGVEVLEAETSRRTEPETDEAGADTFVFTQDSFSVTGTVVMNSKAITDLTGAIQLIDHDTTIKVYDALGVQTNKLADGDPFKIVLEDTVYNYQFSGGQPVKMYLTLNGTLKLTEFICSDPVSDAMIDGAGNSFVMQIETPTNGQNATYRVELIGTAVNTSGGVANVSLRWDTTVSVYGKRQQFVHTDSEGNQTVVDLMGSSYSPENYSLVVEKQDASSYTDMIRQYAQNSFKREAEGDNAVYDIYLQSKSNPGERIVIPSPYSLKMIYAQTPITVASAGTAAVIDLSGGYAAEPESASSDCTGETVKSVSLSGNNRSLSRFAVASLKGLSPGTTGAGYKLSYNEQTDAFLKDPAYSAFYNSNSPIGTAGSFHIVAFDTANLGTHTNGNILAKNLYAGSNFGTNNYPYELTYVQNYLKVNPNSASAAEHVLVVGSSNVLGLYDNGNKYTINGQSIDRPKNIVQDLDTAQAPFIDLNRVRAEIGQIAADLVMYDDANLTVKIMDQKNVITLTDPDAVGILNVTPESSSVFGKDYIQLAGFESGHNGSIVINVDCTGHSEINLPKALVVVDGTEQGTSEVIEFSAGKVLWNFVNAEGVTINTHLMTGMVIAPGATVNINQNLNGTVVADNVNVKAESHRTDFTGKIVPNEENDEHSVTIRKIKNGYVGTTLSGAQFDLYMWNGSAWNKVNTSDIVTDKNGLYHLPSLTPNVAYKLVETKAPAGYLLAEEPYSFWVRESGSAALPTLRPPDFSGDPIDPGGILYVPNEPDTHVETTEIELEKKWSTSQTLTVKRVDINLYQIMWRDGVQVSRGVYKTVTLTSVLNWKYTVTDLPLSGTDAGGNAVTYTYTVEEVPIPGFTPSYSGTTADGITSGKITVTNSQTGDGYVLPETGGRGTDLHTFCGVILITFALMYIVITKRKQRREAG